MADEINETQTFWRADSLATEQEDQSNGVNIPVRASIQMKKPSIDFNAMGPNFLNKKSESAAEAQQQQKKGAGRMLWSMASSLRKMVTKRLGASQSTAAAPKEDDSLKGEGVPNSLAFAKQFEEAIEQNSVLNNKPIAISEATSKFNSFEDQLKQIRLSKEYLENNPDIAQQVLMNEASDTKKVSEQRDLMFAIADDDDDEDKKLPESGNGPLELKTKESLLINTKTEGDQPKYEDEMSQDLDLLDDVNRERQTQLITDAAIAKAACEP